MNGKSKIIGQFVFVATLVIFASSCKKDSEVPENVAIVNSVRLEFVNRVGNSVLDVDSGSYINAAGNSYSVTKFKYYISNISFTRSDNTIYTIPSNINSNNGYFLVDEAVPGSKSIEVNNIPEGDYKAVSFMIGVDSLRNVSGDQSGALDPALGMFWSWNSGYIFLKMEGNSPQAASGDLIFHIGGFHNPVNTIRTVTLPLTSENITVRSNIAPEIHLFADLGQLFYGNNTINFSNLSVTQGDANSVLIADNYKNMFSVDHVHNEPQ